MRRARWIAVVLVGTAACATVRGGTGRSADEGFSDGVRLLEAGDYARAAAVLDSVYQTYWTRPVGRRALLELAALSLDTRNPDRSLWQAADYSARLVAIPQTEPWLLPIGRTMYLTAVELGALEGERDEAVAARKDAEAAAGASRPLPRYQGETVPARLAALEQARDELLARVAGLEQQLRDTTQELARIRRTIKP